MPCPPRLPMAPGRPRPPKPPKPPQATQAMRLPSVTVPSTTVPPVVQLELPVPAHRQRPGGQSRGPRTGRRARPCDGCPRSAPGVRTPRAFPRRSRRRSKPATSGARGSTRPPPSPAPRPQTRLTTETIVTPSLGETSSFWLQPVDPVSVAGLRCLRLRPAPRPGVAVQPPPLTTTAPSRTAPALSPGASFPCPVRG